MALLSLIKKNIKLLIRAKSSSLIVILGPLLIIFLVGVAFDNANTYSLKIGTYSTSYSELSESFIDALKQQEFDVQKMPSEEMCITKIKEGNLHTCIVFPPNMEISDQKQNEIQFHVDYSRINLVWMVMDTLSAKIHSKSTQISENLATVLLQKLDETRVEIYNKNPVVEGLKTQNQDLVAKISAIKDKLNSMDLSLNKESFGIGTLQSAVQANVNSSNTISDSVETLQAKVDQLRSIVRSANITSAESILSTMDAQILAIQNTTESNASWSQINNMVSAISSNLDATKQKLDQASGAKGEIDTNIGNVNAALADAKAKIEDIQAALQKIDASIAGIEVTKATTIAAPITTKINPVTPNKTHLNYLFPSLLVIVIMFISVILTSTLVMMEKNSPAYFRNLITPVRKTTFVLSIYLTNLIVVGLQLAVIFLISIYLFKTESFIPNIWTTLLLLFIITSMFIFLGMLIGYMFKSEETSTLASISTCSVLLILSNAIIPLESLPAYLMNIVRYNPVVISESLIKRSILFNINMKMLAYDIYFLLGFLAVFFILVLLITHFKEKEYFHRLGYNISKKWQEHKAKKAAAKKEKPKPKAASKKKK